MGMYDNPPYYITAYGLAVKRGFVGTLDEWLASLVGPRGPQGIGFVLLGNYETEEALRGAHPTGKAGDCYKVGTGEAETIFYWDPEEKDWESVRVMGPAGPEGPKGATGETGPQGPAGAKGNTGETGPQGPAGEKGDAGDTGPQGPAGQKGETGDTGPQGPVGPAGPAGPKGDTGDAGPQGPKGDPGRDGTSFVISGRYGTLDELMDAHPVGNEGEAWAVGSAADNDVYLWDIDTNMWTNIGSMQGPAGPAGPEGPKGDAGETGPQGPVGPKGDTGDAGPQGPEGKPGEDGTSFMVLGRYDTLDALQAAHPTGSEGDAWAVGSAEDNDIYLWDVDTQAWQNIGSLQGPPGPAGADGKSAYQIAVDNGFEGTEEEWLASLHGADGGPGPAGADGADGTDGKSAYQYAVDGGYTGTEEEFQELIASGPWVSKSGDTMTGVLTVPSIELQGTRNQIITGDASAAGGIDAIPAHEDKVEAKSVGFLPLSGYGFAIRGYNSGAISSLSGLMPVMVPTPTAATHAANKDYVDTHAFSISSNAGAHNSIFRGKYLGTAVTDAQYAAIKAGTFDDLFIGDYWTIHGINWRIAAFDYYLGTGDAKLTTHHAVIVPDKGLNSQKMNDTGVTTGGYVGSKMYTTNIISARNEINSIFSGHVLTHGFYLSNAVTNGKITGSTHVHQDVVLMNERNVYGQSIMSSECNDGSGGPAWQTYDRTQFPLFALAPEFILKERSSYWLRDVVSISHFVIVDVNGRALWTYAGNSYDVRPAFSIS